MSNLYNQISELLLNEDIISTQKPKDVNVDLIVEKPTLFYYLNKKNMNGKIEAEGVRCENKYGIFKCYFIRIPESIPKYQEFLNNHIPLKISLTKLKRVTDGFQITGHNIDTLPEKVILTEKPIDTRPIFIYEKEKSDRPIKSCLPKSLSQRGFRF